MMKNWIKKIGKTLNEKTSPNKPLLTGHGVKMYFLRLLLAILVYVIVDIFIINLTLIQFVLIDALLMGVGAIVKYQSKMK